LRTEGSGSLLSGQLDFASITHPCQESKREPRAGLGEVMQGAGACGWPSNSKRFYKNKDLGIMRSFKMQGNGGK